MACPTCRSEFELVRSIHAAGHPEVPAVPQYRTRLWLPLAAIVTLMAGATFLWQRRVGQPEQPVYRDAPGSSGVTLRIPADGASLGAARRFTWVAVPTASYRFELLDEAGTVAYDREVADTTVTLSVRALSRPLHVAGRRPPSDRGSRTAAPRTGRGSLEVRE